ncbi:hypothetical protein AQUCO_03700075v1 [Aquilegia coerulea]|uniref:Uncharacterized protein n=1 Tax=Aquilegia coerulea TaxID=218851 RepID=A0A2G5CTH1_AQUCA|nr:hypothetical protein AQUCO_03700075v1 [Aquilegia coerulea]
MNRKLNQTNLLKGKTTLTYRSRVVHKLVCVVLHQQDQMFPEPEDYNDYPIDCLLLIVEAFYTRFGFNLRGLRGFLLRIWVFKISSILRNKDKDKYFEKQRQRLPVYKY